MASFVNDRGVLALSRHLQEIQEGLRPGSRAGNKLNSRVYKICEEGHTRQLLQGIDYTGSKTAPLKPSTLKGRRGNGPPRIPRGTASRMVTAFRLRWVDESPGRRRLVMYYDDTIAPFAVFLEHGTSRMAARPTGIDPESVRQIEAAIKDFGADVIKGGGR